MKTIMDRALNKTLDSCLFYSFGLRELYTSFAFLLLLIFIFTQPLAVYAAKTKNYEYDITELSLEELMKIEITTTISRKTRPLNEIPAAVFVVTREDIRRSGATSIPEALKMVPGLEVSKIDANRWTIASRGFNNYYSNKLLVLMDGRTVYTSLFSGVYWEIQDTVLEDIDRIEVIRGPGGTLWGANAVNGVINIVTKKARDTQGGYLSLIGGTEERTIGEMRYGSKAGESVWYRVYTKFLKRDDSAGFSGADRPDSMEISRAGGKMEMDISERDSLSLQGDYYSGESGARNFSSLTSEPYFERLNTVEKKSGWNILAKWDHTYSKDLDSILQVYYHFNDRDNPKLSEKEDVFDLDFQQRFKWTERQEILWGAGYRYIKGEARGSFDITFTPEERTDSLYSFFIQDEISLVPDRLTLTMGSKLEGNNYTGGEIQPSLSIMWSPNRKNNIWAAVSRAVRTPSRFEHDVRTNFVVTVPGFPPFYYAVLGNREAESEELWAYEAGYRFHPDEFLTLDIALFLNQYDKLIAYEFGTFFFEGNPPYLVIPQYALNNMEGHTYGAEVAVNWNPFDLVQLQGTYSYLHFNLSDPNTGNIYSLFNEGASPAHKVSLRSSFDLPNNFEADLWFKYRDNLSSHLLPSYFNMDARIGWKAGESTEISLVGQNLLDSRQPETVVNDSIYVASQIERGYYIKFAWNY